MVLLYTDAHVGTTLRYRTSWELLGFGISISVIRRLRTAWIACIVRIQSIAWKVINSSILCTDMMWYSSCPVEKLSKHPGRGRQRNNCGGHWHVASWQRLSPSCSSATVMPGVFYTVLEIHVLTAPFLLALSRIPYQASIAAELMWAKTRLIPRDFEAPRGQQELAGRCLNSKSGWPCPQCLPSVHLFFLLLLRCQLLPKAPDFISGWPCLSQTPPCSSVHGKALPTSASPQPCHLLLPDIRVGVRFVCWQMLLCGFQCVSIFLLSSDATYLKLKGCFVCFH